MSILVKCFSLYQFSLQKTCKQQGAFLASVHDKNEDNFIKSLIRSQTGQDHPTWLGGSQTVSVFELVLNLSQCSTCSLYSLWDSRYSFQIVVLQVLKCWVWSDGSAFDFAPWAKGEANGSGRCLQTNYEGNKITGLLKISQRFPDCLLVSTCSSH